MARLFFVRTDMPSDGKTIPSSEMSNHILGTGVSHFSEKWPTRYASASNGWINLRTWHFYCSSVLNVLLMVPLSTLALSKKYLPCSSLWEMDPESGSDDSEVGALNAPSCGGFVSCLGCGSNGATKLEVNRLLRGRKKE
ncbi:hypothetical protein [Rhizobium sp. NLR22b]|uniref:hypothetical protein n=1 Tax=Rhizobium sp. NLR22b TaxID=2731115 RepID=UPI001C8395F4|nr:hypothetical protein [Rhizobium sp. NLR22b]MBX5242050.1 hypothetical protein [Rhizobium sp. NLR22b]